MKTANKNALLMELLEVILEFGEHREKLNINTQMSGDVENLDKQSAKGK